MEVYSKQVDYWLNVELFSINDLGATTTASGAVEVVVVIVVVVVGSWDVVRITRQWDNVNDRVVPVDVRASQEETSAESHLLVEVVLQHGAADRGETVTAELLRARVDDRLLVDNLGSTGTGHRQVLIELVTVEVEQGLAGQGGSTGHRGFLAISRGWSAASLEPGHGLFVVVLHHTQVGGVDAGTESGAATHFGCCWWWWWSTGVFSLWRKIRG